MPKSRPALKIALETAGPPLAGALEGEVAGHADAADLHGLAGNPRIAKSQETDIAQVLAGGAFQRIERRGPAIGARYS